MKSLTACLLLSIAPCLAAAPQCPEWSPAFHAAGVDGAVYGSLVHDDGSGPDLYIVGDFESVGGTPARHVARLDGTSWSALGGGPSFPATSIAIYDDGAGPAVYVGGGILPSSGNGLARFDGATWTVIPTGGPVFALHVHDDGTGPALYAGGSFLSIGGVSARNVARYDGAWTPLSTGVHIPPSGAAKVYAFETYDDGTSDKLIVGGQFTEAGSLPASGVALWDGSAFRAVGPGVAPVPGLDWGVYALEAFVDPSSGVEHLYVGGQFFTVGGMPGRWGRWSRGGGWEALPSGPTVIYDLAAGPSPGGAGDRLYGAGSFAASAVASSVFRWDGVSWTPLPETSDLAARTVALHDAGTGPEVFVGSGYTGINEQFHGISLNQLMRWDGTAWEAGTDGLGVGGGRFDAANAMTMHDFGAGPELVLAGKFAALGGVESPLVARFDGARWSSIGEPLEAWAIRDALSHDDGSGRALFLCGDELSLPNGTAAAAMRWDGAAWTPLGQFGNFDDAFDLAVFDEGSGPRLFLAGDFYDLDGSGADHIARWDGVSWSRVGTGLAGGGIFAQVAALEVWDDGDGAALYAAGRFTMAGGLSASHIARWDGTSWSALGAGVDCPPSLAAPCVLDLEVWDSPTGEVLVAAGFLDTAGGVAVGGIAAWDGASWSAFGSGLENGAGLVQVRALAAFDPDGQGQRLYASGDFVAAGGQPADSLAEWDGLGWSAPHPMTGFGAEQFLTVDVDGVRSLYACGAFTAVDDVPSAHLARLSDPCGDHVGLPFCASLANSVGRHGIVRAGGTPSVTAADLELLGRRLPPARTTLFFHGAATARVPFGDGLRCVQGAVQRMSPAGTSDANGEARFPVDFARPYAASFLPGVTLHLQGWYRDPAGGPGGFNTTDGLSITFRP